LSTVKAKQSQQTLRHLRWMLQKDLLGQDMFLMGRPGPARRRLAMQFLQLTGRELEFVALSRDTTEADLKQRREIQGGSSKYFDQVSFSMLPAYKTFTSPNQTCNFLSSNGVKLCTILIYRVL
jgi:hypothetical protein